MQLFKFLPMIFAFLFFPAAHAADVTLEVQSQDNMVFICGYGHASNYYYLLSASVDSNPGLPEGDVRFYIENKETHEILVPSLATKIGRSNGKAAIEIFRDDVDGAPRAELRALLLSLDKSQVVFEAFGSAQRWILPLGELRQKYMEVFLDLSNEILHCQITEDVWPAREMAGLNK